MRRRDRGHEDEHRHRERHDARHPAALVLVAHQRHRDDAGRGDPDALEHAPGEHRLEGGREDGDDAAGHEQREAGTDGGLAADEVGERAEDKLPEPEPEEERGDHELHVVALRRAEIAPDRRQRRQHGVDRERDERHQERDEGHELAGAEHGPSRRRPGRIAGRRRVRAAPLLRGLLLDAHH